MGEGASTAHRLTSGNVDEVWIRERLASYSPRQPDLPRDLRARLRAAAVLVPLVRRGREWYLLFTRRAARLSAHRGQVAFPGGAQEPGDPDLVATALRETFEELGIPPDVVKPVGILAPQPVISGFLVTPVVAILPSDVSLRPAEEEVARVFHVPLSWLADPAHVRVEYREWEGMRYPVYIYDPYDGEVIWGMTARVVRNLVEVLGLL